MERQSGSRPLDFMMRFWRGRVPVDGVLLIRCVLTLVILYEMLMISIVQFVYMMNDAVFMPFITDLLTFTVSMFVCTWMTVGALRSLKKNVRDGKASIAGFVYAFVLTVSVGTFALLVMPYYMVTLFHPMGDYLHIAVYGEAASFDRSIVTKVNEREIHIDGKFQIGLAQEVRKYFEKHPDISTVRLNSNGGSVNEGNKLHTLFRTRPITTYTTTGCHSACTFAFMAGEKRLMVGKNKLGFHAASNRVTRRMADTEFGLLINVLNFRTGAGIDCAVYGNEQFCNKVKATPWYEVWTPTVRELMDYNVITHFRESVS